jgi:hypothetical protein
MVIADRAHSSRAIRDHLREDHIRPDFPQASSASTYLTRTTELIGVMS